MTLKERHEAARKNPPPYKVRKALRESTLAVGREPETKVVNGVTLYRVFDRNGKPVYVSVPEDSNG